MNLTEVWKTVQGFPKYEASSLGRVRRGNKLLKQHLINSGYLFVSFSQHSIRSAFTSHRLIAKTFIANPGNLPYVNHKNGIKTDNRVENLEWCTHQHNVKHSFTLPTSKNRRQKASERMRLIGKKYAKQNGNHLRELSKITSKPVLQFSLTGDLINEHPSVKAASRNTGASQIQKVANGIYKQSGGYKWKWKEQAEIWVLSEYDNDVKATIVKR